MCMTVVRTILVATAFLFLNAGFAGVVSNTRDWNPVDSEGNPVIGIDGEVCVLDMAVSYDDAWTGTYKLAFAIPGGGWVSAPAASGGAIVNELAKSGYLVFSPEYRVIRSGAPEPQCGFTTRADQQRDIETAFTTAWFTTGWWNSYKVDENTTLPVDSAGKYLVIGHSAGGHLAMWLNAYGDNSIRSMAIRGAVSINGVISFLHNWSHDNGAGTPSLAENRNMKFGTHDIPIAGGIGGAGGGMVLQPYYEASNDADCTLGVGVF